MKSEGELRRQVLGASETVGETLVPASAEDGIYDLDLGEIKERFPRRYDIYVKLLRSRGREINSEDLVSMQKWLSTLNALDRYILEHEGGDTKGLREHQIPVYVDLRNFLEQNGNNGHIVMPTGTGKSVVFSKLAEVLGKRTLVVVPTKSLVEQTHEEFVEHAPGISATKFFGDEKDLSGLVTVITYQSLVLGVKSGDINPQDYDCVITDEAHRSVGEERSFVLDQFKDAVRIGFTATPGKLSETSTEIHRISLREAVEDFSALCSVEARFVKTNVDLSNVDVTSRGNYDEEQLEKAINIASRNKAAVEVYRKYHEGESAVVYCTSIKHSQAVTGMFQEAGIVAETISGKDNKVVQQDKLTRFKNGEIQVLCNADILIEGFNAPRASVCINLRPTLSIIIAEQRAGRVLRLDKTNPGKVATVIDFIDDIKDPKRMPITFPDIIDGVTLVNPNTYKVEIDTPTSFRESASRDKPDLDIEGVEVVIDVETVASMKAEMDRARESISKYKTYAEASEAAIALGIKSFEEYCGKGKYKNRKRYEDDPRLPSNPNLTYAKDWVSWANFLGKEEIRRIVNPYETYIEARDVVLGMNIGSSDEYRGQKKYKGKARYVEDQRLPSNPDVVYAKDWVGWKEFLGKAEKYETLELAKEAVRKIPGISSANYSKKSEIDDRLPSNPNVFYRKKGWRGWPDFLGKV